MNMVDTFEKKTEDTFNRCLALQHLHYYYNVLTHVLVASDVYTYIPCMYIYA